MAARTIRLDPALGSTLVVCSACGFRDLATDPLEARRRADDHRRAAHRRQAIEAESKRRRRRLEATPG